MRYTTLFLFIVTFFSACQKAANTDVPSPDAKHYALKGTVISVNRTARTAKIDHEPVEGYMDAMTMEYPIHADYVWDELKPGCEIRADLVVDKNAKDPAYLENISIIAAPDPNKPAPEINEKFAQIGKDVPDFSLTDQDGKRISIKDFRGKALAITFIYAKCPLPDYCIKMSTNFSDLAKQINADADLKNKIRLLSISFDPENDTPAKLKAYGLGYMGHGATDLGVWQLAVGTDAEVRKIADFFGLQYTVDPTDKTKINHSLRTAVIAPDGKVTKIYTGNDWTAAELLAELKAVKGQK